MTVKIIIDMIELALSLVKNQSNGKLQHNATVAAVLVSIINKAIQAYESHTGQPLDVSLIKPEAPV
jgi:hypothetical protein